MAIKRIVLLRIKAIIGISHHNQNLDYDRNNPINHQTVTEVNTIAKPNRPFKHWGGWQTALKAQLIEELSFPSIMSCNGRSKLNKIGHLTLFQNSSLYKHAGIVRLHESWLNRFIHDLLPVLSKRSQRETLWRRCCHLNQYQVVIPKFSLLQILVGLHKLHWSPNNS